MRNWNKVNTYSSLRSWQRKAEQSDKSIAELKFDNFLTNGSRKRHERIIAHTSFGFLHVFWLKHIIS